MLGTFAGALGVGGGLLGGGDVGVGLDLGSTLSDLKHGYLGTNQRNIPKSKLSTARADQERALALQSRGMQSEYGNFLRAAMAGEGPSVAEQQMLRGRDQAIGAAMSAAASGRGSNAALAARGATDQAAQVSQQSARDAAMIRAQEQQAYAQQYGSLAQAMRQQDLMSRGYSIDEAKAQLDADTAFSRSMADVGEGEATRRQKGYGGISTAVGSLFGLSDVRAKSDIQPAGYSREELTALRQPVQQQPQPVQQVDPMALDAEMMRMREQQEQQKRDAEMALEREQKAQQQSGGGLDIGGFFSGLGSVSDVRGKKDIQELENMRASIVGQLRGEPPTARFEDAPAADRYGNLRSALAEKAAEVPAYEYRYREPFASQYGPEKRVGVMAQDLEKNPLYAPAVETGPDGMKRVDPGQATMTNTAVLGEMARLQQIQDERIREIERVSRGRRR